jgi:HAD superfamily 5'-nucleotidase-like hydrolase
VAGDELSGDERGGAEVGAPSSTAEPGLSSQADHDTEKSFLLELLAQAERAYDIQRSRRLFVNRNLRMDLVQLIGFDMDYTLAIYNQDRIDKLSIECTVKKLIAKRGYPAEILDIDYDPQLAIRGIVVDKELGNVFKMDRHGHVGKVYHGRQPLSRDEQRDLYRRERIRLSAPRYAWIDTLFALPEAAMYVRLVDYLDEAHRAGKLPRPDYVQLFNDIRMCIDEAHRDESMKTVIKADLPGFLQKDPELALTLHKFRSSGKKLFLMTNSLWDYTDCVMTYLLDGELPAYPSWRNYFDIVVVGAAKPTFFTDRPPFYELDVTPDFHEGGTVPDTVTAANSPSVTGGFGGAGGARIRREARSSFERGRVYQGGNLVDFEEMAGIRGDQILYVGDHIYGDILRSKKSSAWRTAMIIQEMEEELGLTDRHQGEFLRMQELEHKRARLDDEVTYQQLLLKSLNRVVDAGRHLGAPGNGGPPAGNGNTTAAAEAKAAGPAPTNGVPELSHERAALEAARKRTKLSVDRLRRALRDTVGETQDLEGEIDKAFNPYWGLLFKEGNENSRFGEQVADYACVYTSRVSNFLSYSPLQYFRAPRDVMPHERE